ncbi:hypothetical protein BH09GEM1_BH09GEM1_40850 [soil metagenome]
MSRPGNVESNASLAPHFADFIAALNAHGVEFVLVGGYAVAVYGVIRATGDLDIFHRRTTENVRKLMAAMREFGAPEKCIDEAALMDPDVMIYFGQEPFRIDLLNSISGVTFDDVWAKVFEITTDGERIRVIGRDDLLANKRASGRKKDKQDVKQLTKLALPVEPRGSKATSDQRKTKRPAQVAKPRGKSTASRKPTKQAAKAKATKLRPDAGN